MLRLVRLVLSLTASLAASLALATPASADDTNCHTVDGPFPTVQVCTNIPNPFN